jgi:hypothetical protein
MVTYNRDDVDENWTINQKIAYGAIQSGLRWLINQRKETDAFNRKPWTDEFTGNKDEQTIMSTLESLTVFTGVWQDENRKSLNFDMLPTDILFEDLHWVINELKKERGTKYSGKPYLPYVDEYNLNFTDCAAYVISAFSGALYIQGIDDRLKTKLLGEIVNSVEWLVNNKIIINEKQSGWGWIGSTDYATFKEAHKNELLSPQTYFTYSAIIGLSDALILPEFSKKSRKESRHNAIITLHEARDFLLSSNRVKEGWIDYIPTAKDPRQRPTTWIGKQEDRQPGYMDTCLAVLSLCYLINTMNHFDGEEERDLVDFGKEEIIVHKAVKWILECLEEDFTVLMEQYRYVTSTLEIKGYVDGTAQYVTLNALNEYWEAFGNKIEHNELDPSLKISYERLNGVANTLCEWIFNNCWYKEVPDHGFRHFEVPGVPDDSKNIVTIYATCAAIEALFGMEPINPNQDLSEKPRLLDEFDKISQRVTNDFNQLREVILKTIDISSTLPVNPPTESVIIEINKKLSEIYEQIYEGTHYQYMLAERKHFITQHTGKWREPDSLVPIKDNLAKLEEISKFIIKKETSYDSFIDFLSKWANQREYLLPPLEHTIYHFFAISNDVFNEYPSRLNHYSRSLDFCINEFIKYFNEEGG